MSQLVMKVGICTKERRVRVSSLELTFMGRRKTFEADAEVTFYPDDTAHVEWLHLCDLSGHAWPIDKTGMEGFDLSGFDDMAIDEARKQ